MKMNPLAIIIAALCLSSTLFATEPIEINTKMLLNTFDLQPKGKNIVFAGKDKNLYVWDKEQKNIIFTLKGHEDEIKLVKYSPNARLIASSSADGKLLVWDAIVGEILNTYPTNNVINAIVFSNNNQQIACANDDKTVTVWHSLSVTKVATLKDFQGQVTAIAYNNINQQFLTAESNGTIKIWDTNTWEIKQTFQTDTKKINQIAVSKNGKLFAISAPDTKVKLFNIAVNDSIFLESEINYPDANTIAFSTDNQILVIGGTDNNIHVWDVAAQFFIQQYNTTIFNDHIMNIVFDEDSSEFAVVSRDGIFRTFQAPDFKQRKAFFLAQKTNAWKEKTTFESENAYQKRLEELPQHIAIWEKNYNETVLKYFEKNTAWANIKIKKYLPDEELYFFESPVLGNLFINIAPNEAEKFKINFEKHSIKTPHYTIDNDGVRLDFVEVNIPIGNDIKGYLLLSKY
jgi:WD domain, G-beta repeat